MSGMKGPSSGPGLAGSSGWRRFGSGSVLFNVEFLGISRGSVALEVSGVTSEVERNRVTHSGYGGIVVVGWDVVEFKGRGLFAPRIAGFGLGFGMSSFVWTGIGGVSRGSSTSVSLGFCREPCPYGPRRS